jgi:hypothetical protein
MFILQVNSDYLMETLTYLIWHSEVVPVHAVKTHIRAKISAHPFLTSAIVTMSDELHAPNTLPNRKASPLPLNRLGPWA